jgi:hypothetical protein
MNNKKKKRSFMRPAGIGSTEVDADEKNDFRVKISLRFIASGIGAESRNYLFGAMMSERKN